MASNNHITYGMKLKTGKLREAIEKMITDNQSDLEKHGELPAPIAIWGTHGLGKTALVEAIAKDKGWHFAYLAPAQFEELGDLHGLPVKDGESGETSFLPPAWVPTEEGPGILLLDDINRADDRILRGLMQLLQLHSMGSWKLPAKWQILVTCNPEGGDYSVTPLDGAMTSRWDHLTIDWDPRAWAQWALSVGIDARCVDFVLCYPEVVGDGRTTPRTLARFFRKVAHLDDWEKELDMIAVYGHSTIEETTVHAFLAYVRDNLQALLLPEDILTAKSIKALSAAIDKMAYDSDGRTVRIDRLGATCTRMYLHLAERKEAPTAAEKKNFVEFLCHRALPNDLKYNLHKDISGIASPITSILDDQRLANIVLGGI